jgi:hypothetical protein
VLPVVDAATLPLPSGTSGWPTLLVLPASGDPPPEDWHPDVAPAANANAKKKRVRLDVGSTSPL